MKLIGPEPNFVTNMPCVPEKLLTAAYQLFHSSHIFDYMDRSPGYVWKYPAGEHKVGRMIDWGYRDPATGREIYDNRPDVNCAGLVNTPAHATGCNPHDRAKWLDSGKIGDVFRFELPRVTNPPGGPPGSYVPYWHTGFVASDVKLTFSGYEFWYLFRGVKQLC